jgi:hypothetical protein
MYYPSVAGTVKTYFELGICCEPALPPGPVLGSTGSVLAALFQCEYSVGVKAWS